MERLTNRFVYITVVLLVCIFLLDGHVYGQNFATLGSEPAPIETNTAKQDSDEIKSELAVPLESMPFEATVADESKYTLGVKDVIRITVLRHPEVSGDYAINSEGNIQYEFIGDIHIIDRTKGEIKEILTEYLSEYIIEPDVNIKIIGYNSKVIYVIGEVARPGKIFMRGDTITIREALVQSGLPF